MNAFKFNNQVKKDNNNQVNLIESCDKGFYVSTLNGRTEINEMSGTERKMYPTLEEAKQSEQLKKYASFNTYLVVMNGTDYANAKLVDVKSSVEKIRTEITKNGGLSSFPAVIRKNRPVGCPMKNNMTKELQDLSKEEIHVAFHLGLIGNASVKGSIVENPKQY